MIIIFTDGACEPNPGIGGWGWHASDGKQGFGGESNTTNNRMEMVAILEALKAYPDGMEVKVFSDSQYCVKGLTIWRSGWRKAGWRKKGEDMPNRSLWLQLETQLNRLSVQIEWVRGHDGNQGNEKADALARMGRASIKGGTKNIEKKQKSNEERILELENLVGMLLSNGC